jgi:hypothetical protein
MAERTVSFSSGIRTVAATFLRLATLALAAVRRRFRLTELGIRGGIAGTPAVWKFHLTADVFLLFHLSRV